MIGATVTMDMERAKELEPIKKQKYEADAKAALAHTKVKAGKKHRVLSNKRNLLSFCTLRVSICLRTFFQIT